MTLTQIKYTLGILSVFYLLSEVNMIKKHTKLVMYWFCLRVSQFLLYFHFLGNTRLIQLEIFSSYRYDDNKINKWKKNKLISLFSEYIICRQCGVDITISNFFLNKISPSATATSNQSFYKDINVLVQTLENPLGISFRVFIVKRAHCANTIHRVSTCIWFDIKISL